jgi:methyl acetate hydrolase
MATLETGPIDELLRGAVADGAMHGVVAVVGDRDGLLYHGGAGALPDGTDTMFRIASMTKAATTVATLQLVEDGLIDLDTEVASILPELGDLPVLDGFDGDTPRLRPATRPATVRQLLTHTSGCGYAFADADLARWHEVTGTPISLTGERRSLYAPLVADAGTTWAYGTGCDWAGLLVEAVRGNDLATVFAERVCGPLGLTDATFSPTAAQRRRLLDLKERAVDGSLQPSRIDLPTEPDFAAGGHGLYATAGDYLRLLRALLRGGELDGTRVLRRDLVDQMFTDQLDGISLPSLLKSAAPEMSNDIPSLPFAQGWGCGLQLFLEDIPGMRRAGSGSWAGLMNSYYWIDRVSGVTAALFTQVLPFFDAQVVQTTVGLEQLVYAGPSAVAD